MMISCALSLSTSCQMQQENSNHSHPMNQHAELPDPITQEFLDSLSQYPQGSMQSDLYYKLILEKYPDTHEAYMSRSVSYTKRGEHAIAFSMLDKAVALNPVQNLGYRSFVKLYMLHDYEGALADCLRLDSLTAYGKPGVWGEDMDMVIGLCYLQLHETVKAREYLSQAVERIDKKYGKTWVSPRTLLYLGMTHLNEKAYRQSLEVFDELSSRYPNYTEAYYYKAVCYQQLKNQAAAKAALEQCRLAFDKHGVETNPYFEMPYQVYPSMLSELSEEK